MASPRNSNYTVYTAVGTTGENETVNSQVITGYLTDGNGNLLFCAGTATITDGGAGYAPGCEFILTNATVGSPCVYLNKGSSTSSKFTLVTQS